MMIAIELDALGTRLERLIVASGATINKMVLYPQPEGLVIAATINGRSAAVRVYPGSTITYARFAEYLLRECQAGIDERFPQDADLLALHEG
jgi:hypothetical protein